MDWRPLRQPWWGGIRHHLLGVSVRGPPAIRVWQVPRLACDLAIIRKHARLVEWMPWTTDLAQARAATRGSPVTATVCAGG